ncbi:hypothetical protein GCM10020295_70310 [Streptomyces cinereospinus]
MRRRRRPVERSAGRLAVSADAPPSDGSGRRVGSDLIRKEEILAGGVRSVWDAEMVPAGDDRIAVG